MKDEYDDDDDKIHVENISDNSDEGLNEPDQIHEFEFKDRDDL